MPPKPKVQIVAVQVTGVLPCDHPNCDVTYNWTGETSEQCEQFLAAILAVHKRLWHPR